MRARVRSCLLLVSVILNVKADTNNGCASPGKLQFVQSTSRNGQTVTLDLERASFVGEINIKTCADDRALADGPFTVKYVDPADALSQERVYLTDVHGITSRHGSHLTITFDRLLYVTRLSLSNQHSIFCSQIYLIGCDHQDLCNPNICKNGGTCVGNGQCACTEGFMGATCENSVQNMTFDDFGFVADVSGILYTQAAAFNVSGNISFTYDDGANSRRNLRSLRHSHSFAHFLGHGGSLNLLSSHIAGFLHSHHNTFGHSASHSVYSALHNFAKGFSHTVQAIFGHNHHHGNTHYFYTTHGTSHYSHGSSLHYSNHHLHMHVHFANSYGHNHHFHIIAAFRPKPGVKYTIASSFSPHFGVSIYVNGHRLAPLSLPNVISNAINSFGIPRPLCIGLCGGPIGHGPVSLSIGNIGVAGASVPTLAGNALLGLLGLPMLNLLGGSPQTTATLSQTALNGRFTSAPTTTVTKGGFTLAPTTTVTKGGFTLAPTTLPPATATTANLNTITSPPTPVCYACANINGGGRCLITSQCYTGEVCAVFSVSKGYTHRCMSKQLCETNKKSATGCWNCCTSDRCNDRCVSPSTCQDQPRCSLLRSIGYNVCNDPIASVSLCPHFCNKCPATG